MRMPGRTDGQKRILIEQHRITGKKQGKPALVAKIQPTGAIRHDIGIKPRGGVQRRTHTGTHSPIPALKAFRIKTGIPPQTQFLLVGAAVIPTTDKASLGLRNRAQRICDLPTVLNVSGIVRRTNQNEIIVHDLAPMRAIAFGNECLFCRAGMHQDRVHISGSPQLERLTRANNQKLHLEVQIFLDFGQQDVCKTRVVKRCCDRHPHRLCLHQTSGTNGENAQYQYLFHSTISPLIKARASAVSAWSKNAAAGLVSCTLPPSIKTT
mmetsp:Transcript_28968/g.55487  ORF Transcript_28968/g.55487 Transcript_28968/m.55487 type:complete len:266 (-) Transcript_28968:1310-2107(-)